MIRTTEFYVVFVLLFCMINGCANSNQQFIPENSGAMRYPSSQPHVLNTNVKPGSYAAPYLGENFSQGGTYGYNPAIFPGTVPTHCNNIPYNVIGLCEAAKSHQIPMSLATDTLTLAGLEYFAIPCGYECTESFNMVKNSVMVNHGARSLYALTLNNAGNLYVDDKQAWCKQIYLEYGPNSPFKFIKK